MEYSNKWLDNIVCYSKQCYEIRTKAPPYTSDMQCIAKGYKKQLPNSLISLL